MLTCSGALLFERLQGFSIALARGFLGEPQLHKQQADHQTKRFCATFSFASPQPLPLSLLIAYSESAKEKDEHLTISFKSNIVDGRVF